jgi:thymidine phosphorylase
VPLAQEIIRAKRDGHPLTREQIEAFVRGLVSAAPAEAWSEGQVAALAMAIVLRGMDRAETVALTAAMTHSGAVLDWRAAGFALPVLDKHSTGGVGDKVSLVLAPLLAACGALVPMVSGRGLGHTGGTLDKMEALPGYQALVPSERLAAVLRSAGCAIVGASETLAPADRRLYAIRDVTATVESVPLITASILSKKLAGGVGTLLMDVKVGNGAFCPTLEQARALARSLVEVAGGAGLPTTALLTDMNQVLGWSAGNALEVREAIDLLTGVAAEPRLLELILQQAAQLLWRGGLQPSLAEAREVAERALASGAAAERFARMVAGLGGPADVLREAGLPEAPARREVPAPHDGWIAAMDARALGIAVVELGGGRRRTGDSVDPRVGLSGVRSTGTSVRAGEAIAVVHAADHPAAETAVQACLAGMRVDAAAPPALPLVHEIVDVPSA